MVLRCDAANFTTKSGGLAILFCRKVSLQRRNYTKRSLLFAQLFSKLGVLLFWLGVLGGKKNLTRMR